ncbi:stalk domain-containing protein [Peptococcus simiae]|uniref:stalk domain-containing protein n=1 Tax=Peptococcus simiae TaxID=1643805 RepID=UPI003980C560
MQVKGKKVLSLLLALALLVSVIPVRAQAAPTGGEEDGTYTTSYTSKDGHVKVASSLTPVAGELNKFHVKRVITGQGYPKKREVVFAIDTSNPMFEDAPGYEGIGYVNAYLTYVKDAIGQALDFDNRAKDGAYFKDLDVFVMTYNNQANVFTARISGKTKKQTTAELKTAFDLVENEAADKKAKIPEKHIAYPTSLNMHNNISHAIQKGRKILTDPGLSSVLADKHLVLVTASVSDQGVHPSGGESLLKNLEKAGVQLDDVVETNPVTSEPEIKVVDKAKPMDIYTFADREYTLKSGITDTRFLNISMYFAGEELKAKYPNGINLNMAKVIQSEANIAAAKGITIHAIGLETAANQNNAEYQNYLAQANSNTPAKPTSITDYSDIAGLRDQIKAILDADATGVTNPLKDGQLTEKIRPGFQVVPGSVKVTGGTAGTDYTLTTDLTKYDGKRQTNIDLNFGKLPQAGETYQLTLEYDLVADDNLVKGSVIKDKKGYSISNYALKYTNPSTNLEEKDQNEKPLYANPTILELTKKLVDQANSEVTQNPDGHDYVFQVTSGDFSKTYKVDAGQTVKTTLRDPEILTEVTTVPAGDYTISENLVTKAGQPLTYQTGDKKGQPIKAESLYEITYTHPYQDDDGVPQVQKLNGGAFALTPTTGVYPITGQNKYANIGRLTIDLSMLDLQGQEIGQSTKTFQVKVEGKNKDRTVYPYIKSGAAEPEPSTFDLSLNKPVTLDKLPLGTYTITLIDPATGQGFDLTNPAPVTFTLSNFEQTATAQAKVASRTYEVTKLWGQDAKPATFPTINLQVYGQVSEGDKALLAQADGTTEVAFAATGHGDQTGKAIFTGPKVDNNGAFYTYSFKEVGETNGQVSLAGKTYTVSYDTAKQTITNSRVPETYSLAIDAKGGKVEGLTPANAADGKYKEKTKISFTVAPPASKAVATVKANDTSLTPSNGTYTFTITKDTTIAIDYKDAPAQENHTVTLPADGNLTIENPPADGKYPDGKEISFKVNPPEGKEVDTVKANDRVLTPDNDGTYHVTITEDTKITVTYKDKESNPPAQDKFKVTVKPEKAVTIEGATADNTYAKDSQITFTLNKAPAGKEVDKVQVNGTDVSGQDDKYSFKLVKNSTITVTYKDKESNPPAQDKFKVTVKPEKAVTIEGATADNTYAKDSQITFTLNKAPEGKEVDKVQVNGKDSKAQNGKYSFKLVKNSTITVTYKDKGSNPLAQDKFKVTVKPEKAVTIEGATADNTYAKDSQITFTLNKAPEGKEVDKVQVNGTEVSGQDGKYSFKLVKDSTITVTYKDKDTGSSTGSTGSTGGVTITTDKPKDDSDKDKPGKGDSSAGKGEKPNDGTKVTDAIYTLKIGSKDYTLSSQGKTSQGRMDVAPIISNGRTMLPVRFVGEVLGADVTWDNASRTASFTKDGITAVVPADGTQIVISGGTVVDMDAKPLNIDGRLLLPLTNISKIFDLKQGDIKDGIAQDIEWDGENQLVVIRSKQAYKEPAPAPTVEKTSYTLTIGSKTYALLANGEASQKQMDVAPVISNGRTMLPVRFVAEVLGADVTWDEASRTASFSKDGLTAVVPADGTQIVLSNGKLVDMDAKPLNIDGRILLPLTNISQIFNLQQGDINDGIDQDIEWDGQNKVVVINCFKK